MARILHFTKRDTNDEYIVLLTADGGEPGEYQVKGFELEGDIDLELGVSDIGLGSLPTDRDLWPH